MTYGGKPIAEGHITFDPITPGAGGGFAKVVDGKCDTRHEGRDHPGGAHRVTVVAYKGLKNPKNPDSDVLPLFPAYEVEVEFPKRNQPWTSKYQPTGRVQKSLPACVELDFFDLEGKLP